MSRAVIGMPEVSVIDEIAPAFDDYIFWKVHWDPWEGTTFELSLRRRQIDIIIVNGGTTQIGIAATVFGAHRLLVDCSAASVRVRHGVSAGGHAVGWPPDAVIGAISSQVVDREGIRPNDATGVPGGAWSLHG